MLELAFISARSGGATVPNPPPEEKETPNTSLDPIVATTDKMRNVAKTYQHGMPSNDKSL